jgi:hypothetical protein
MSKIRIWRATGVALFVLVSVANAAYEDSPFGMLAAEVTTSGFPDRGFYNSVDLGVRWNRGVYAEWPVVEPTFTTPATYSWTVLDKAVTSVPTSMHKLSNIFVNSFFVNRRMAGSYLPIDQARYVAFVAAVVERYDGDGLSDAPTLTTPIKYWQVDNEPDAGTTADFDDLQAITYQAIKQADPIATVFIGGFTAAGPTSISGWIAKFNTRCRPILNALAGQYVDGIDVHWYGTGNADYRIIDPQVPTTNVIAHVRTSAVNAGFPAAIPIWVTEMGSESGWSPAPRTEAQQAQDLFKRYVFAQALGVKKIFQNFPMEGFLGPEGYFDHTGLLYEGNYANDLGMGVRKLAYYSYKKMTEKLEGGDWGTLVKQRDGTGTDHLYAFAVSRNGVSVRIAWWDYFDEPGYVPGATKPITLSGISASTVYVTPVVPGFATGSQVTDYATAFGFTSHQVSGGSITLSLGENPVIIEEVVVTAPPPTPDSQTPYPGPQPAVVPGVIEAENFDAGAQGVAYFDTSAGNAGGAYRGSVDVDIFADANSSNGHAVSNTAVNDWMDYAVTVAKSGRHKITLRVAAPSSGKTLALWADHLPITAALPVPTTGGSFVFQDLVATDVALSAGQHTLTLSTATGGFTVDKLTSLRQDSIEVGKVVAGAAWTTINLQGRYAKPVVVTTVNYRNNSQPVVTRVRNADEDSFNIRLQNPGDQIASVAEDVHYLVIEEGKWLLPNGVKIEAKQVLSDDTNDNNDWSKPRMELYPYQQSYVNPVILGQVMTANDPKWSAFWSRSDGGTGQPCTGAANCYVGKHVGEDTIATRANETLGIVVVETSSGVLAGVPYQAFIGADIVRGIGNAPPYVYGLSGFSVAPMVALGSVGGMDDANGRWAYLYGVNPLSTSSMWLATDEDEIGDVDRAGGDEQVGVIALQAGGRWELTPQ